MPSSPLAPDLALPSFATLFGHGPKGREGTARVIFISSLNIGVTGGALKIKCLD